MSKDAENFIKERYPAIKPEIIDIMAVVCEKFHVLAREKELASLTDEVIEGMATKVYPSNGLPSTDTARAIFSHHIKLFRDHLKQKK